MTTEITTSELSDYTQQQRQLITDVLCKGGSSQEIEFFMQVAQRCRLDPFKKQIYAVKRYDSSLQRETLTFQVSIDGLRAVAARTGEYAGSDEPIFVYDDKGFLLQATVTVWRLVKGNRVSFTATAFYDECVQTKKGGEPNAFWKSKPRTMLGKCAEAGALRKAFPEEAGGLHTEEEIQEEHAPKPNVRDVTEPVTKLADAKQITLEEAQHWSELLPNLYKQVFVKLHNCTVAEFVTDRDKRSEFVLGRPDMPEGLEAMAADCIIFKVMEQQFVKLGATEDQVSTELNRRGVIQGSILEQDGNTLFDLQPEIQALVKEGWKP